LKHSVSMQRIAEFLRVPLLQLDIFIEHAVELIK